VLEKIPPLTERVRDPVGVLLRDARHAASVVDRCDPPTMGA
jgi:hypothetical protein